MFVKVMNINPGWKEEETYVNITKITHWYYNVTGNYYIVHLSSNSCIYVDQEDMRKLRSYMDIRQ